MWLRETTIEKTEMYVPRTPKGWVDVTDLPELAPCNAILHWALLDQDCLNGFGKFVYVDQTGDVVVGGGKDFNHHLPYDVVAAIIQESQYKLLEWPVSAIADRLGLTEARND